MDPARFVYLFPFFMIGMWVLVSFVISRFGWAELAAQFATNPEFIGQRVGMISASINSAAYRNSLVLKYNNEGIYLRPVVLFRLFHPPILIPWTQVRQVNTRKTWFFTSRELVIGEPVLARIVLDNGTFRRIEAPLRAAGLSFQ